MVLLSVCAVTDCSVSIRILTDITYLVNREPWASRENAQLVPLLSWRGIAGMNMQTAESPSRRSVVPPSVPYLLIHLH